MGKKKQIDIENEGVKYTELYNQVNPEIDKLVALYNKDRYNARVVFMNNTQLYTTTKVVLYEKTNGDWQLVTYIRKFGISISNIMYSHEKKDVTVSWKQGKKKIWLIRNKSVLPLSRKTLSGVIPNWGNNSQYKLYMKILREKFNWLEFQETNNVLYNTPFNTIITHKLYNLKKALKYQYKVVHPVAKILHKFNREGNQVSYMKYYLRWIKNIENLNKKWVEDSNMFTMFYDTIKMGKTLDRQVNCSWSDKRLRQEHDNWSEEIAQITFTHGNRDLTIHVGYVEFAEWCGWELLTDTKSMALEGLRMKHCVASYVNKVDMGSCAIFHVEGSTLEVKRVYSKGGYLMECVQFRTFNNEAPPSELVDMVKGKISEYNDTVIKHKKSESSDESINSDWDELGVDLDFDRNNLPF